MEKTYLRYVITFFLLVVLFFTVILSIVKINTENYTEVSNAYNSRTVTLGKIRHNFFDCNLKKLTGNEYEIKAVVSPTDRAITAISSVLNDANKEDVLNKLSKGETVTVALEKEIVCDGIVCVNVPKHISSGNIAQHLIGYLDYDGNGISGLEKAYNGELVTDKEIAVRYAQSGNGNKLYGIEGEVNYDTYEEQSGIMLTVDSEIQSISERALKNIKKGAVVISKCNTGEICAMASKPTYDVENLTDSLNNEDNPFLNRAINSYNIGSVFKLCVAAAGIESGGNNNYKYNCTGNTQIDGHTFNCHFLSGHGEINLENAVKYSCNTFFYNFAISIGAEKIYNTALKFGFGRNVQIADKIKTENENFPELSEMQNSNTSVANIAIGQGTILASPVKMLNLYSAIACGGIYRKPYVVKGKVSHGIVTEKYSESEAVKAISKDTALLLKRYLKGVIEEGTGKKAKPDIVSAAGKTATAENYEGYDHSWFCGFFPYENPKYTVVVFSQCAEQNNENTASVFKEIADEITKLQKN